MNQHEEQNWLQRISASLYGLTLSDRQLRNRRRGRFIFTDRKHPWRGVFSVLIGIMSLIAVAASVLLTYRSQEEATGPYAVGVILALVYALCGLIMGILAGRERDIYAFFPRTGIIVNSLALLCTGGILVLGLTA